MYWQRPSDDFKYRDQPQYDNNFEIERENEENRSIYTKYDNNRRSARYPEKRYTPLRQTPQYILQNNYPRSFSSTQRRLNSSQMEQYSYNDQGRQIGKAQILSIDRPNDNDRIRRNKNSITLQPSNANQLSYVPQNNDRKLYQLPSNEYYPNEREYRYNRVSESERGERERYRNNKDDTQDQNERNYNFEYLPKGKEEERERSDQYQQFRKNDNVYANQREQYRKGEDYPYRGQHNPKYQQNTREYYERYPQENNNIIPSKSQNFEHISQNSPNEYKEIPQRSTNFDINRSRLFHCPPENIIYSPNRNDYLQSRYGDYTYNYFLNSPMRSDISEDWKYPPQYYYLPRFNYKTYTYQNK